MVGGKSSFTSTKMAGGKRFSHAEVGGGGTTSFGVESTRELEV